jgi:hypothetical protein
MKSIFFSLLLVFNVAINAQVIGQTGNAQVVGRIGGIGDLRALTDRINSAGLSVGQQYRANLKKAKKYVAPAPEYKSKYQTFLDRPETGIIRLLPGKPCPAAKKKPSIKECPQNFIAGNGSHFSFRWKEYVRNSWTDLENLNGFFVSNGADNQGILVNLGDVAFEDVTLKTSGMEFLTNFVPSTQVEEVGRQFMQLWNKIEAQGFRYAKILPIEASKTYALRAVAYERDVALVVTDQQKKSVKDPKLWGIFDPLRGDKRQDVIVVFRVLEKSEDGSATIIWKELQNKKSPYLKANNGG